ncbi:hypothetical protein SprV_0902697300 [Sparganum proliferum]
MEDDVICLIKSVVTQSGGRKCQTRRKCTLRCKCSRQARSRPAYRKRVVQRESTTLLDATTIADAEAAAAAAAAAAAVAAVVVVVDVVVVAVVVVAVVDVVAFLPACMPTMGTEDHVDQSKSLAATLSSGHKSQSRRKCPLCRGSVPDTFACDQHIVRE